MLRVPEQWETTVSCWGGVCLFSLFWKETQTLWRLWGSLHHSSPTHANINILFPVGELTCPGSWLCWSFCFPSSPRSHWWSAPFWAAAAGSSAWWQPGNRTQEKNEGWKITTTTKIQPFSTWELLSNTNLLACCYVDGRIHSTGCSGGTHDQKSH